MVKKSKVHIIEFQLFQKTFFSSDFGTYDYNAVATYQCNPGRAYDPDATRLSINRTCQWNGEWDIPSSEEPEECQGNKFTFFKKKLQ